MNHTSHSFAAVCDALAGQNINTSTVTGGTPTAAVNALLDVNHLHDVMAALARITGLAFIDLNATGSDAVPAQHLVDQCDLSMLETVTAIPMMTRDGTPLFVCADPFNVDATSYLRSRCGAGTVVLAPVSQVQARLLAVASAQRIVVSDGPDAVPSWVDGLLTFALAERASDIHLRFNSDGTLNPRVRVDGVLRGVPFPAALTGRETEIVASLLSRAPTIDVTDLRQPQDGGFQFAAGGRRIDIRVAAIPTVDGPNVTLRLLDSTSVQHRLEDMGFSPGHVTTMKDALREPAGLFLSVGPTGAGKSTLLYGLISSEIDVVARNVCSVEDPVEFRLPGVGQTSIREGLGDKSVGWERALKSLLRSDPDVIFVGEMRSRDVVDMCLSASISGHLVLSTLHATTAPGALIRLTQMGAAPHIVSEAILGVSSQRLIRTVHECATVEPPTATERDLLRSAGLSVPDTVAHPVGCNGCAGTGYRGRQAIAELLIPDSQLRDMFAAGTATIATMRDAARHAGWEPLIVDAMRAVSEHATTISEVDRVVGVRAADPNDFALPPVFSVEGLS